MARQQQSSVPSTAQAEEILRALDHVQKLVVFTHASNAPEEQKEALFSLMSEDEDWLVVMQTLIEQGFLYAPEHRPPFSSFLSFVSKHNVRTYLTDLPSVSTLSRLNSKLQGATYPWETVTDSSVVDMLPRWRMLHDILVDSLQSTCNEKTIHCISSATK